MHLPVKRYLALLSTYLKPQRWRTLLMTVCLLASIGLQLLNPQLLRYFIDTALTSGATMALLLVAGLFIAIALLNQAVSVATTYLGEYVAWTATNQLRSDLVAHCLKLDMSFHKSHTSGELIERIDGDVNQLANFFSLFVVNLFSSALLLLGVLVLLLSISWLVGLAMTCFSVVTFLVLLRFRRVVNPFWLAVRQMSADFFGFIGEQLHGTEDIRANGATAAVMRRFYLLLRRWLLIRWKAGTGGTAMWMTASTLYTTATACALALSTYFWSRGTMSIGTIYLIYAYTSLLSGPIQQIQEQLQDLQQADACIQRVEELLHTRSALSDQAEESQFALPSGALSVEFQHVSFGYVQDEPIIHDLTLRLEPGRMLGVVGRTGSGKTTLARLLFRLYDPQFGEIHLGGVPTTKVPLHDLRHRLGMVTQEVQIFHASLRDNLTFFNRSISDARVLEALEAVGLMTWYGSLPAGLESELGADGSGLSAGEAQLLAFARVFLANPGLVILDGASS